MPAGPQVPAQRTLDLQLVQQPQDADRSLGYERGLCPDFSRIFRTRYPGWLQHAL